MSGLYVASYRMIDDVWAGASVPMPLDRAKAFILDAIDRVKDSPIKTTHTMGREDVMRAFKGATGPLTLRMNVWEFRLESAGK